MQPRTQQQFDAVTLEVLWTRLISMVDEAAAALVRTSFSTVVRESHDFSCVLTDEQGHSLVQATESIPSFIGTLPKTVGHFLAAYPPEALTPGDVMITYADVSKAKERLGYRPTTLIRAGLEKFLAWYRAREGDG